MTATTTVAPLRRESRRRPHAPELLRALSADVSLAPGPDLLSYDHYLISLSGGKDSQAMLDVLVEVFHRLDVLDRVTTLHADMGRSDWPATAALTREHAVHYGLRHEVVARTGGDLLDRVAERGKWPSHRRRWCIVDWTNHHRSRMDCESLELVRFSIRWRLAGPIARSGRVGRVIRRSRDLCAQLGIGFDQPEPTCHKGC
ncbi:hypothetical protein [Nocardia gipuzkoensis]